MQQYIRTQCDELDVKYKEREQVLRRLKDKECSDIINSKYQLKKENETQRKVAKVFAEAIVVIGFFTYVGSVHFSITVLLFTIGLCVAVNKVVNIIYCNKEKQIDLDIQNRVKQREQLFLNDIRQLNQLKSQERNKIEDDINRIMNQYRKTFEQSVACGFLVEWIINILGMIIKQADRSKWLPQVKSRLCFHVAYDNVEIKDFGKYNMANQGIQIDNNPMAVGALAYVLEKRTLSEAKKRFTVDPGGGRVVFTSARIDADVEIIYSAPNGNAQAL